MILPEILTWSKPVAPSVKSRNKSAEYAFTSHRSAGYGLIPISRISCNLLLLNNCSSLNSDMINWDAKIPALGQFFISQATKIEFLVSLYYILKKDLFSAFKYLKNSVYVLCLFFSICQELPAQKGFLENKGQFPEYVKFNHSIAGGMCYYGCEGIQVLLKNQEDLDSMWSHYHYHRTLKRDFRVRYHRFDIQFESANFSRIKGIHALPTRYN